MCGLLRKAGYDATSAMTGADGLAAVRSGEVDLVLLDLGLPDLTGSQVCRRIRRELGEWTLPVIAMTGYADRERRIEMSEAGADDFIAKPVCRDELLARVRNLLNLRALYKQAELDRQEADRETVHWQLVADCAITTGNATTYPQLVAGFARVLRLGLTIDDVAYLEQTNGLWSMAAASGGGLWPAVLALAYEKPAERTVIEASVGESHVVLLPVRCDGQLRGNLAVTKSHGFLPEDRRTLRELTNHLGALIAKLPERSRMATVTSPGAVTMRMPRLRDDN